jgi:hypothetical protein
VRKRESTEKIPMRVFLRLFHLEDLLPLIEKPQKEGERIDRSEEKET